MEAMRILCAPLSITMIVSTPDRGSAVEFSNEGEVAAASRVDAGILALALLPPKRGFVVGDGVVWSKEEVACGRVPKKLI